MVQSTTAADPDTITATPRVITVEKNAAYPKAIAALKAAGMLPEQVELKTASQTFILWWMPRPQFYQAAGQAWDGLLFC